MHPVWQRIDELDIRPVPRRTVLEAGQWQGSNAANAHLMAEGAAELAAMIPADHRVRVPIGDDLAGNLAAIRSVLPDPPVITVGGDCGVEVAPIEAALARHGDGLVVVWFDAHGDLNTPESSPSGAFHGMVLRTLLGDGPAALAPRRTLRPAQVVLAGTRALDAAEKEYIEEAGIAHVDVPSLASLPSVVAWAAAKAVYIHIDLDVLDPATFDAVGYPEPEGVTMSQLATAVRELTSRFELAGLGITEYAPDGPANRDALSGLLRSIFD
jgi:arginase family enzyme